MKSIVFTIGLSLSGFFMGDTHGQIWEKPYANGSADDHLIRFDQGPTGTVIAPNPGHAVGYNYSAASSSGTASGWHLVASGSVGVGNGSSLTAQSNAFSRAGGENLRFGADTAHKNLLPAASVPMTWSGSATITDSTSWVTATNHFRYNFDIALDNQLVDGFPSIFDGYNLTITAGAHTLYSGVGLKQILGVAVIDQNMYHNHFVSFDYHQVDGPLVITWSGAATLTGAMLDGLGNGDMDIIRVHQPSITTQAIPEPASIAFLVGSLSLFAVRRRYQPAS